jgi:hypothetical protein
VARRKTNANHFGFLQDKRKTNRPDARQTQAISAFAICKMANQIVLGHLAWRGLCAKDFPPSEPAVTFDTKE